LLASLPRETLFKWSHILQKCSPVCYKLSFHPLGWCDHTSRLEFQHLSFTFVPLVVLRNQLKTLLCYCWLSFVISYNQTISPLCIRSLPDFWWLFFFWVVSILFSHLSLYFWWMGFHPWFLFTWVFLSSFFFYLFFIYFSLLTKFQWKNKIKTSKMKWLVKVFSITISEKKK
jgi:hypothetical protein